MLLRRKNAHRDSCAWADLFQGHTALGRRRIDPLIVGITVALSLGGLIMVFSASGVVADMKYSDSTHYLQRQIVWMVLGFIVLFIGSRIDYQQWKEWVPWIVVGCVAGLLLVLAIGMQINGAKRWLTVGFFSIQPTEMAKLAVVLYLAAFLSNPSRRVTDWRRGFLPPVVVVSGLCFLIVVEPDLGSIVVIGLVFVCMMYLAGGQASTFGLPGVADVLRISSPHCVQSGAMGANDHVSQSVSGSGGCRLSIGAISPSLGKRGYFWRGSWPGQAKIALSSGGPYRLCAGIGRRRAGAHGYLRIVGIVCDSCLQRISSGGVSAGYVWAVSRVRDHLAADAASHDQRGSGQWNVAD